jgi:hypothetical protein
MPEIRAPLVRIERRAFFLSDIRCWLESQVGHHSNDKTIHSLGELETVSPVIFTC